MHGVREYADAGRFARAYARTVVALRYVIVVGWVFVVLALAQLPEVRPPAARLEGLVPPGSAAVRTEAASLEAFGFPLTGRTILVQRDPEGLSPYAQARVALRAAALSQGGYPESRPLVGGLPVSNTLELFPSSSENGTTALTYLFAPPGAGLGAQTRAARELAAEKLEPADAYVGVTGTIPARVAQARILQEHLSTVETATLVAIVTIVGLYFRSLSAPLVALSTAGLAFFLALQTADRVGEAFDVTVPDELEPLILALVLGIVTDYVIFFLAATRRHLVAGVDRLDAARAAAASTGPIVAVAGLAVAAGTGVLVVADSAFFSAFGPALALAVSVACLVSLTLVPALLAIFGRALLWPGGLGRKGISPLAWVGARWLTRRPVAALVAVACVVGLAALATNVSGLRVGVSLVSSLPEETEAREAAVAAAEGFAPGVLSPTVLLVRGDSVGTRRDALGRLGDRLGREPGVAGVVGPADLFEGLERGILVARSEDAARFLVILADEPLGATAIDSLAALSDRAPQLGRQVGLEGVRYGFGGDTALALELVEMTRRDLGRIAIAALVTNLLLLMLFLRAVVAPIFLLASSVLALGASLGAMTYVFQDVLGHDGITFYVPFASAVLLLSLGSDYNIFGVGYVWERAARLPLRAAIAEAVPATSSAISVAGMTLAVSFAMLVLVPLRAFRELAFVMSVGILVDALVVRSILVPSTLSLLGSVSAWPRRLSYRTGGRRPAAEDTEDETEGVEDERHA